MDVETLVYLLVFFVVSLYAVGLEYGERRWQFVQRYTWLTAVVGDGLILAFLRLLVALNCFSFDDFTLAVYVTVVAGIPILLRELIRHLSGQLRHEQEIRRGD
jgi:hypothetical protein